MIKKKCSCGGTFTQDWSFDGSYSCEDCDKDYVPPKIDKIIKTAGVIAINLYNLLLTLEENTGKYDKELTQINNRLEKLKTKKKDLAKDIESCKKMLEASFNIDVDAIRVVENL